MDARTFNGKFTSTVGYLNSGFAFDTRWSADLSRDMKAVMIFVDFPNARACDCEHSETQYYYDMLADDGMKLYDEMSFGKIRLSVDGVMKWFRMPLADGDYSMGRVISAEIHRNYIEEAIRISEDEVDYSAYDIVYIVPPENAVNVPYSPTLVSRSHPVKSKSGNIGLAVTFGQDMNFRKGKLFAHETGHIMGLPDLYTYEVTEGASDCFGHIGTWDLMGLIEGLAPDYLAYHKWRLGWIDDSNVTVVLDGECEIKITPVEKAPENGFDTKLVIIPVDEHCGYAVESRRGIGLDTRFGDAQGVLIYYIDGHIRSGYGCLTVIPPDAEKKLKLPVREAYGLYSDGMRFSDEANGIEISVTKCMIDGDVIAVKKSL